MRFDIPELKDPQFETEIAVRYGDMDALGHVNGATYFRYLEEIRMQWLERIGVLPDPAGEGPVLVNAYCTYLRQTTYPATLTGRLFVHPAGRSALDCYSTLTLAGTDTVQAMGGATVLWMDFAAEKARPLPDWFVAKIA